MLRLHDIVEDADRLERFLAGMTVAQFAADEKTKFAVERLLQRITEAVIQIGSDEMSAIGPDLPLTQIRAFGNRLRHDYRNLDAAEVFTIARRDVPVLAAAAARALEA